MVHGGKDGNAIAHRSEPVQRQHGDGQAANTLSERDASAGAGRRAQDLAPSDIASQALDKLVDDAQSGDVLLAGGFQPQQLALHYLRMASGREPGAVHAARIDELADKLLDRLLVSGPSATGSEEVRMRLVGEVLEGSEIWMRRENGEMRLEFVTKTGGGNTFLSAHSDELATTLTKRLGEAVRIDVRAAKPHS